MRHRQHRNKYQPEPQRAVPPFLARAWCDARESKGGYCQRPIDHPGPHVYAARKR